MKKNGLLIFVCLLGIVSCVPIQPVEMTIEILTLSETPFPSFTSRPTQTRVPSRTPLPTITPRPSLTSSLTSTAGPLLSVNKWRPETVLIKLEHGGGDGCCLYSYPPSLVMYANGRIIINQDFEKYGEWRNQPMTKVYSREETCSILNTIDQTGFLYYNTSSYRPQNSDYFSIDGASDVSITVNAWRSNHGEFFGLSSYLYLYGSASEIFDDPGSPIIPPALRDVFYFLSNLSPADVEIYQPARLGMIATKYDEIVIRPDSPFEEWPFDDISLADIEKLTSKDNYPSEFYITEGSMAASIYKFFGNSFGSYGENVRQHGQEYVVFLRPLLPYEIPQLNTWNILPDPDVDSPEFYMECFPSDGILPIPTPQN